MRNDAKLNSIENSFKIPSHILRFGRLLQMFSVGLAAKYADLIFSTPHKVKIPDRELMMRKSAKESTIMVNGINKKIMTYTYGYSKRKVLLVHGWSGRGTQLYSIADKILENKMMVVSFDGPAHGLSSGRRTTLFDFVKCILQMEAEFGPFDSVIGHSFGATAILNAVLEGFKINKIVLIGSDNSLEVVIRSSVDKFSLKPSVADEMIAMYNKRYGKDLAHLSSQNIAKKIKIDTFVVHDSGDKFVNVSSAVAIRHSLENGELLITNGLGHYKILRDQMVNQRIIDFIL